MNSAKNPSTGNSHTRKEMRLSLSYAAVCIAWAALAAFSDYTLENNMVAQIWVWPMVLLPIVTAPLVFYFYYRFYCGVDELARKVQANGLAMGFGLGVFALISFMSLANVGIEEPGVNEMFAIFAVAYGLSSGFMAWRYYH